MYHIIDEIPFDFFKMFMHYLSEAISQTKMNIPYRMALTKIFIESGLRILPDEPKEVMKHTDFYTTGTLTRMDFRKEEEKWIKKLSMLLFHQALFLLLLEHQLHHHHGHPSLHFLDHHHLHQLTLRPF